ncbi:hypothetical protein FHS43_001736 [Streptosporangium becharense]|uniref:Squalene cyclase C-terminal domain-containing protein n=1 Tax=Streptosporangium becharense TaxID=1816182 RepID=A0A7W9IMA9_9ACTN|nr:hypothetical protein [Streptosporangium becharense]MBB2910473.1 hypothetical protein [Streptosporangium becharense]MBB5823216.1 hypothetical protein [Streptosporangium becharense]
MPIQTTTPSASDLVLAADEVLAGLTARPLGEVSASEYETGRVITLAPWMSNLGGRLGFLLGSQHADGTWGAPNGYDLIPTLSAAEALLTVLRRWESRSLPDATGVDPGKLAAAAGRALAALRTRLRQGRSAGLPDTVAAELITPALVAEVNGHLDRLVREPVAGLDAWGAGFRLDLPADADAETLARVRAHLRAGGDVPFKLWHSLEVMGDLARAAASVRTMADAVGCTPAATAAWLGERPDAERFSHAMAYLEDTAAGHGGAVPTILPVTFFERIWTINILIGAGIDAHVPPSIVEELERLLDAGPLPGAPGLPPEADTTSTGLATLARLGRMRKPDLLWEFEEGDHFCCYLGGERTPSETTNAHILEAFGEYVDRNPEHAGRYRNAMGKIVRWLAGVQHQDGFWTDKWHASPYYATYHCATALDLMADAEAENAVRRAVEWTVATQNDDGSWGIWGGTGEETAYAVHILLHTRPGQADPRARHAATRGGHFLRGQNRNQYTPMWHGKDVYSPIAVCRAAPVAALYLTRAHAEGSLAARRPWRVPAGNRR